MRDPSSPRMLHGGSRCGYVRQCGALLIEALVALVVVSIAAAGLFTLMANALRASGESLLRAEAAELAAAAVARMNTENPATLTERYDALTNGPGFVALLAAARRLPGVTDTANRPAVAIGPGPSDGTRSVVVTVGWQTPSGAAHRASMSGVVGP